MIIPISYSSLPTSIEQLLAQKDHHTSQVARIDNILGELMTVLGNTSKQLAESKSTDTLTPSGRVMSKTRQRTRRTFAVSATDLVLAFVKKRKNPATSEITRHLLSQGRSAGAVSNALSVLTQQKKLTRKPLGGGAKGSTYSLA